MNTTEKQSIRSSRKLKYGTLSAGFVAVVVALCVAVNLLASALSVKWDLRVDITDSEERFYTISEATQTLFEKNFADDPAWQITFRFLAPEDKVSDKMVLEMARAYQSFYSDHITIEFADIYSDPALAEEYGTITQTVLTPNHVLVEGKHHIRAVNFSAFYAYDTSVSYEPVAFTGEKTLTAAILRAGLKESPTAVLTVGHGETLDGVDLSDPDIFDAGGSALEEAAHLLPLIDSLFDMGFDVKLVDLDKQALPDNTRLVIVCDPKYDFLGFDPENPEADSEIDALRKYLNAYNASLMVAVDSETPELPNLMEFLQQDYGLSYEPNRLITDNTNSIKGSGGRLVLGQIPSTLNYTMSNAILSDFTGNERFVFNNAVKLTVTQNVDMLGSGVLINSHNTAVAGGTSDIFPLVAYTSRSDFIDGTELRKYGSVYLMSSTEFLSGKGLVSQYANRDLLESILRVANTINEYSNVEEDLFADEALNITTGKARLWTIVVTFVMPAAVFAVAAVVWARRRHS